MTAFVTSAARLPRTSAIPARARSAAALAALNYSDVVAVVDAAEPAPEYAGTALREIVGQRKVDVFEAAPATINGLDALSFAAATTTNAGLHLPMAIGQDYFIACAVNILDTGDTSALFSASDLAGDNLFFGLLTGGALRLAHGATAIQYDAAGAETGTHVFWATRRASDGAAEVAMDVVTAPGGGVGTVSVNHTSTEVTRIAGGPSPAWEINGSMALAVVGNTYRGGASNAGWRADVLGYLAERVAVTLT